MPLSTVRAVPKGIRQPRQHPVGELQTGTCTCGPARHIEQGHRTLSVPSVMMTPSTPSDDHRSRHRSSTDFAASSYAAASLKLNKQGSDQPGDHQMLSYADGDLGDDATDEAMSQAARARSLRFCLEA